MRENSLKAQEVRFYRISHMRGYPFIRIPKAVLEIAGFKIGDHIFYLVERGSITIKKVNWREYEQDTGDRD